MTLDFTAPYPRKKFYDLVKEGTGIDLEVVKEERALKAAMIDKNLKVYKYTQPGTGLVAYFCDEELKEQPDPDAWKQGTYFKHSPRRLRLNYCRLVQLKQT